MSESWRIKRYYDPRVLIDVAACLEPPFPDSLVCLTGAQLNMLRNLTQYLHRRITYVSEYHDDYYLAPTNDEFDQLEAIVAELETELMGCTDITEQLAAIAAAVQCLCDKETDAPQYTPATTTVINNYYEGGEFQPGDDYGPDIVVDEDRCAVAQLIWQQMWEWLTEIVEPIQIKLVDVILPAAMIVIGTWLGASVVGIPGALILALIWNVIQVWKAGAISAVENALETYQDEIVCAAYDGLWTDLDAASVAVAAIIDGMAGISALDKETLKAMSAPWCCKIAQDAWDNQSAWAVANVEAGACDSCAVAPTDKSWSFPPCPGGWVGNAVCYNNRLSVNQALTGYSPDWREYYTQTVQARLECTWYSKFGSGWTVGYVSLEYSPTGENPWSTVFSLTLTNYQPVGSPNSAQTAPQSVPFTSTGRYRVTITGQAGQGDTNPYPCMASAIKLNYSPF